MVTAFAHPCDLLIHTALKSCFEKDKTIKITKHVELTSVLVLSKSLLTQKTVPNALLITTINKTY